MGLIASKYTGDIQIVGIEKQNSLIKSWRLWLLNNIRSKLIVLFQIGAFVDRQESIITEKGELLPCLARGYTTYAEALRRDLEALFAIKRKPSTPSYEKTLRALQGGKR